jgi:hypothetical protein
MSQNLDITSYFREIDYLNFLIRNVLQKLYILFKKTYITILRQMFGDILLGNTIIQLLKKYSNK